jgi:hypothetical protein
MTTEGLPSEYYLNVRKSNSETILAIIGFSLFGVILISSLFLAKDVLSLTKSSVPVSPTVSNVTDRSFTVSWKTNGEVNGYVIYGTSPDKLIFEAYDNKDDRTNDATFKAVDHAVTLTNLDSNTYYYYKIISDKRSFNETNGKFFEPIKTTSVSPFLEFRYQNPTD